jgi:hypothetical protein
LKTSCVSDFVLLCSTHKNIMKIKIPGHAKPHLVEYIELQMEAMDDEQLQSDLDAF